MQILRAVTATVTQFAILSANQGMRRFISVIGTRREISAKTKSRQSQIDANLAGEGVESGETSPGGRIWLDEFSLSQAS